MEGQRNRGMRTRSQSSGHVRLVISAAGLTHFDLAGVGAPNGLDNATLDPGLREELAAQNKVLVPKQLAGGLVESIKGEMLNQGDSGEQVFAVSLPANAGDFMIARHGVVVPYSGTDYVPRSNPGTISVGYLDPTGVNIASVKGAWNNGVLWGRHHNLDRGTQYNSQEVRLVFAKALELQFALARFGIRLATSKLAQGGELIAMPQDFQLNMIGPMLQIAWQEAGYQPENLRIASFMHIPEIGFAPSADVDADNLPLPEAELNSWTARGIPGDIVHDLFVLRALMRSTGFHSTEYQRNFLNTLSSLGIDLSRPESLRLISPEAKRVFLSDNRGQIFYDDVVRRALPTTERLSSRDRLRVEAATVAAREGFLEERGLSLAEVNAEALQRSDSSEGTVLSFPHSTGTLRLSTNTAADVLAGTYGSEAAAIGKAALGKPFTYVDPVKVGAERFNELANTPTVDGAVGDIERRFMEETNLGRSGFRLHRFDSNGADLPGHRADVIAFVGRRDPKCGASIQLLAHWYLLHLANPPRLFAIMFSDRARRATTLKYRGNSPFNEAKTNAREKSVIDAVKRVIEEQHRRAPTSQTDAQHDWLAKAVEDAYTAYNLEHFRTNDEREIEKEGLATPTDYDYEFCRSEALIAAIQAHPRGGLLIGSGNGKAAQRIADVAVMPTDGRAGFEFVGAEPSLARAVNDRPVVVLCTEGAPVSQLLRGADAKLVQRHEILWSIRGDDGRLVRTPDGKPLLMPHRLARGRSGFLEGAVVLPELTARSTVEKARLWMDALRRCVAMGYPERRDRSTVCLWATRVAMDQERQVRHQDAAARGRDLELVPDICAANLSVANRRVPEMQLQ